MAAVKFFGKLWGADVKGATDRALQKFADKNPHKLAQRVRPPNNVTGRLRSSWYTDKRPGLVEVGSRGVPYVIYQEEGTRYIAAKQMLGQNVEAYERGFRLLLSQEIKKELG